MTIYSLNVLFLNFEPVCCFMSCSKCCLLTCIQVSQETGKVVWYFSLFKYFPLFVVIHTVKGFSVVNEAKVDFLEFPCFFYDPMDIGNLISGSSAFSKSSLYILRKLGKEYIKAVYCHPAYLTYMQSTSCKMWGWMKNKSESKLLGEISITSDVQMTPPLWQKVKKN